MASYFRSLLCLWHLDSNRRASRVVRFLFRSGRAPSAFTRWLDSTHHDPMLRYWCAHSPRLFIKPSRHYINRDYSIADRIQRIESHYRRIGGLFSAETVAALAQGQLLKLAEFSGKSGLPYEIVLRKTNKFDREGELGLVLKECAEQDGIFYLIFSLPSVNGTKILEIGCLQGEKGDAARARIRQATKDMLGNRPKMLLMEVMSVLAHGWQVDGIVGVSNANRVFSSARTYADYDAFWQELGARPGPRGMFDVPSEILHKSEDDIDSKHRSAHRKKMAFLATMRQSVATRAAGL
ncbi:DUF535 family protein [uncultured Propionivibrio sp.]|uniref:VirK/YbjX family protein n=1 Tax=uncultured Propionivibrio sp. TaxID=426737 RepID=UPI0029C0DFB1|nr:DUF535 family protein [uncultured Propionivibrio sp.]